MAIIQTPQPGQPLDLGYISTMATAINKLSDDLSSSQSKRLTVVRNGVSESSKLSDAKVVGISTIVSNNLVLTSGGYLDVTIPFDAAFKKIPIVTVTPVLEPVENAGRTATAVIKAVTTSSVTVSVEFGVNATASVGLNIIAIGFPV